MAAPDPGPVNFKVRGLIKQLDSTRGEETTTRAYRETMKRVTDATKAGLVVDYQEYEVLVQEVPRMRTTPLLVCDISIGSM